MDADYTNQDLCTFVTCGELMQDKVNITVYNNTDIDFDTLYWSIGGQSDTINVLAFDQFSCWKNFDSLSTAYLYAEGVSFGDRYFSDTVYLDVDRVDTVNDGNYRLTVYQVNGGAELSFSLYEGYDGQCVSFD